MSYNSRNHTSWWSDISYIYNILDINSFNDLLIVNITCALTPLVLFSVVTVCLCLYVCICVCLNVG